MNANGLQQRLKSPRDSQSNGGPARTARGARKKGGSRSRRSNPNRAALVATSLFICVVIPLVLLINKATRGGGGGGGARSAAGGPASDRFVEDWRPSGAKAGGRPAAGGNNKRGAAGPDAEARRRARAERHESLYRPKFGEDELGFDIYDCPDRPPEGYPRAWTAEEVLTGWDPLDVTTVEPDHREVHQGICVFDYQTQYETALRYRDSEVPFIIRNNPTVDATVARWDDPRYLLEEFGETELYRTERSPTNQFIWYKLPKGRNDDVEVPPNDEIKMHYPEFVERALMKDGTALGDGELIEQARAMRERRLAGDQGGKDDDGDDKFALDADPEDVKGDNFYYFRLNADLYHAGDGPSGGGHHSFIYDEVPIFDPRDPSESEFYMVEPDQQRGINCRFGMRGVTAANHFDFSRNMIAILGGERRYVIGSPAECSRMALYPRGHISLRHSSVRWHDPKSWEEHPEFKEAMISEVVMRAGDVLYLPTAWFHYIINLSFNYQCNARSGTTYENQQHIEDCGFGM